MSDLPEDRLKILLPKYLEDKLTAEERLELSELAMKSPRAWEMLAQMRSTGQLPVEFQKRQQAAMERGLHKIEATIRRRERSLFLRKNGVKWMLYGMSAAAVIGGVIFFTPSLWKNKPVNATAAASTTLTVPRGGQNRVILPDGTKVWLNNVSSLRYPVAFTGNTREVAVTGEAYFEVAKDAGKPFTVKVNDVKVQVLGTAFNISAYTTGNTRAVLLEGSVRITDAHHSCLLKPGQALATGGVNKWKVVTDEHAGESISWTKGLFDFRNAPLSEVVESLGRSYNVEVDLKGMKKDPFCQLRGVSRQKPLPDILKMLDDAAQFRLEGRKLIVTTN